MGKIDQPSQPPLADWWYQRLQAVGRSANRYLLLLLSVWAYTLGVHLTPDAIIQVQFLGLRVEKYLVEAFGVCVLAIAALAFLGATEAFNDAHTRLAEFLSIPPEGLYHSTVDQNPSLIDFLGYATIEKGKSFLTNIVWLAVYPLTLGAALIWAVVLWWDGIKTRPFISLWLTGVHFVSAMLLIWAYARTFRFVKSRWTTMKAHQ